MYKKGWRGINIDLNPLTIELFDFFRNKDININRLKKEGDDTVSKVLKVIYQYL